MPVLVPALARPVVISTPVTATAATAMTVRLRVSDRRIGACLLDRVDGRESHATEGEPVDELLST
jgi:hypothetical protein